MEKHFDIYAIGHAIIDIQAKVTDDFLNKFHLSKGEMRLVSEEEQQALIKALGKLNFNQASGGSAANSIIALSQLGGTAAFCGLVGDDEFGRFYFNEMKALGVEYSVSPLKDKKTGICLIYITPDAERTMNTFLGASSELKPSHLNVAGLSASKWLYIEGYILSSPNGPETVKAAVRIAKENNVKIAVSCSDSFIVELFGDLLREILAESDLCFANEVEGQKLIDTYDSDDILGQLKEIVPNVVLTRGAQGVDISYQDSFQHINAYDVRAIDTTGAGDMFAGAFLYGLTHQMGIAKAGELATFLCSKIVTQLGPRLPSPLAQIPGFSEKFNNY